MNKPTTKTEQCRQEAQAWTRLLAFYRHENALLKTRLADVVDLLNGKEALALAEHFQNMLINKDEMLDELRHDVYAQERMLQDKDGKTVKYFPEANFLKKQSRLRNEIGYFEKDYVTLRNDFNKYLLTAL